MSGEGQSHLDHGDLNNSARGRPTFHFGYLGANLVCGCQRGATGDFPNAMFLIMFQALSSPNFSFTRLHLSFCLVLFGFDAACLSLHSTLSFLSI